ncbi:hypothetical protein MMC16_007274 [Acarospora aff. strigata]|nr:hypothetical protein [Acarospora aff. strigata]
MQKVLRRTALAERQAARAAKVRKSKRASEQRILDRQDSVLRRRSAITNLKQARIARREDWQLGPLAPRRDVGAQKDTYGTADTRTLRGKEVPKQERMRFWPIMVGDRVVVMEGREKGKIGMVKGTDKEREELTVEGLNKVDFAIPKHMLINEMDKRPVRSMETPFPITAVRLVYPLPHPETGIVRDVVVKKLVADNDKRYIPGLGTQIPWPPKEPEKHEDHDEDTLRMEVEAATWVPTLLRPPMPPSVIDELRNKYSVFRTRHDDEYIAKKMAEDVESQRRRGMRATMRTPVKQLNRKERAEKQARGKPELSEDMLAKIGELMAAKKGSGSLEEPPPA